MIRTLISTHKKMSELSLNLPEYGGFVWYQSLTHQVSDLPVYMSIYHELAFVGLIHVDGIHKLIPDTIQNIYKLDA